MLNPNLATAWSVSGRIRSYLGEPELAIEHLVRAMRLSPRDPLTFLALDGIAWVHLFAGRYDEMSSWAEKALRKHPNYIPAMRMAAAGNALAGRLEEAQKTMARMREIDPSCVYPTSGGCPRFGDQKIWPSTRGPPKSGTAGMINVVARADEVIERAARCMSLMGHKRKYSH